MPQVPIIVPVIVIGILVGSLLKSNRPKIPWKKITAWALVAGVLNAVLAYAEVILTPQPTFTFRAASAVTQVSEIPFSAASFLTGFIIVMVVFGIAAAYLRMRGTESGPELENEEEPQLDSE